MSVQSKELPLRRLHPRGHPCELFRRLASPHEDRHDALPEPERLGAALLRPPRLRAHHGRPQEIALPLRILHEAGFVKVRPDGAEAPLLASQGVFPSRSTPESLGIEGAPRQVHRGTRPKTEISRSQANLR